LLQSQHSPQIILTNSKQKSIIPFDQKKPNFLLSSGTWRKKKKKDEKGIRDKDY